MRQGPNKHSKAKIAAAIMRYEAGSSLSEIAREEGVNKSLVKYWVDHAEKYVPQVIQAKRAPAVAKLLRRGELVGWRKFVQLISLRREAIEAMDGLKRVEAAEKLKNILVSLAGRGMPASAGPDGLIELSEKKAKLIVRDWFSKKGETSQDAPAPEPPSEPVPEGGAAPEEA